ncbi:MAG: ExeM/NucH family extracellular endonuclease [Nocardioides sp.]
MVRQQDKIVAAINAMDADVVSLEEIENSVKLIGETDRDDALAALTSALNAAAGSQRWAFVPSPPAAELPDLAEQDVIRTAFLYNPAAVQLVGGSQVLVGDPAFANAREPLAQVFKRVDAPDDSGYAVIVNHFKSKGDSSPPATGDNANGEQGAFNGDRVRQAQALAGFAEQFAVDRGVSRILLTGDFNSYTQEDPMRALYDAGYTKVGSDQPGDWSYSFSGLSGSLDHVLANDAALADVTGADVWEINANESVAFEYSRHNYNVTDFYAPDPYRASDHNPEVVGIVAAGAPAQVQISVSPLRAKIHKDRVKVRVRVTGAAATPTGTVTVSLGGVDEATVDLDRRGRATVWVGPFRQLGPVEVVATYSGDGYYGTAASDPVTVQVVRGGR